MFCFLPSIPKPSLRTSPVPIVVALGVAVGALASSGIAAAATATPGHDEEGAGPRLEATIVDTPIVVDGSLGDAGWREAEVATGFIQREPHEGEPATERTEVRVVYTETMLYIGIMAYDSSPDQIVAEEMERDGGGDGGFDFNGRLDSDDSVIVVLDTFHDHRNGFLFETNPNAARSDALITDEGRDRNFEWDGVWWAEAAVTSEGWAAELAIPFYTLRFPEDLDTWGFNVRRRIRRNNEEVYWATILRDTNIFRFSDAGHLSGLGGEMHTGLNLRVKPFMVASSGESLVTEPRTVHESAEFGLDVRWGLTDGLTLDLTYNTDFAQVEVDEQRVNLTRFSLFFPEKREFFLENAGIFDFGAGGGGGGFRPPLFKLFFSRRIGIGPGGNPTPILGGAKLTGRVGQWNLGVLDVQTESATTGSGREVSANNWGVFRLKRNVGERSSIGVLATNRQGEGDDDWNRTLGFDADLNPHRKLSLTGFYALSDSPGLEGDEWAGGGGIQWRGPIWEWGLDVQEIRENFEPEMGFLLRRGIRRYAPEATWQPRPGGPFRNLRINARSEIITTSDGTLETASLTVNPFGFLTNSEDFVTFFYSVNFERLFEPFELQGVVIPAGEYTFSSGGMFWRSNDARVVSFGGRVSTGEFFNGTRTTIGPEVTLRPSGHFNTSLSWDRNDVELPGGAFVTNVVRNRTNVSFTPNIRVNSFLQYSDADELLSLNLRFNWIYRPGADFFLVYNQGWTTPSLGDLSTRDKALIAKFTYLFQF